MEVEEMKEGDSITVDLLKQKHGSYMKYIPVDWLEYLGFSPDELKSGRLHLKIDAHDRMIVLQKAEV